MSPSPEMVHVDGTFAQRAPSPLLLARNPRTCKLEAAGDNRAPAAWRGVRVWLKERCAPLEESGTM
jgi:hypothetical protein